jgi:hypothetical protein
MRGGAVACSVLLVLKTLYIRGRKKYALNRGLSSETCVSVVWQLRPLLPAASASSASGRLGISASCDVCICRCCQHGSLKCTDDMAAVWLVVVVQRHRFFGVCLLRCTELITPLINKLWFGPHAKIMLLFLRMASFQRNHNVSCEASTSRESGVCLISTH